MRGGRESQATLAMVNATGYKREMVEDPVTVESGAAGVGDAAAPSRLLRTGVVGASGYPGAELVRLLARHRGVEVIFLTAERNAGKSVGQVHPHLDGLKMPVLAPTDDVDMGSADVVFTALPDGRAHTVVSDSFTKSKTLRVIDLSGDFRLADTQSYGDWYGHAHRATGLQQDAVYGLTEVYRPAISGARLVANPGCYPTVAILALAPLLGGGVIRPTGVVIDAKLGVTGGGRQEQAELLHGEISAGVSAYGVGRHRHMPEIEQELSRAASRPVTASFTPHMLPMNRGVMATCYVRLAEGREVDDLRSCLETAYTGAPFVHVAAPGVAPSTRYVRGSNHCVIGVFADRVAGRAIVLAVADNLMKGAAGQAVQNMNVMFGLDETEGLDQVALFP